MSEDTAPEILPAEDDSKVIGDEPKVVGTKHEVEEEEEELPEKCGLLEGKTA